MIRSHEVASNCDAWGQARSRGAGRVLLSFGWTAILVWVVFGLIGLST
jgi:hypothetical protein